MDSPVVLKKVPHPTSPRLLCGRGQLNSQTQTGISVVYCRAGGEKLGEETFFKTTGEWCPFSVRCIFFGEVNPQKRKTLNFEQKLLSILELSSFFSLCIIVKDARLKPMSAASALCQGNHAISQLGKKGL